MSGIEIGIGVISAVAALITAYKDGHKIADQLEKALKQGEHSITRLQDKGAGVQVDDKAAQALKDLIIEVQGSLLHQLAEAEQDDNINDFSSVTNTAIRTRRKAETVLNELYLRAEDLERREPTSPSPQIPKQPTTRILVEEEPSKESRLKFWRRSSDTAQDKRRRSSDATPVTSPITAPQSPTFTRQATGFSNFIRRSTFSTSPSWNSEATYPITEENNFGGFCKGAWRAQRYELSKAVTSSIKSFERKFHCTKCSYMLPADMRDKNHPRFDDRVYKVGDMQFRMLFLLKSHLPQRSLKDHRLYRCMLCALTGKPARSLAGEGHLLEHVFHHQYQVFGEVTLVGTLSVESDGVKAGNVQEFDLLFDRGEDFALPPSMLDDNQSLASTPLDLPEEAFGNVWADQKPGTNH